VLTARICAHTLEFSTPLLQVGINRFLVRGVIGRVAPYACSKAGDATPGPFSFTSWTPRDLLTCDR
jgi:hypothetical protein